MKFAVFPGAAPAEARLGKMRNECCEYLSLLK
jgi:hypothetical protein